MQVPSAPTPDMVPAVITFVVRHDEDFAFNIDYKVTN